MAFRKPLALVDGEICGLTYGESVSGSQRLISEYIPMGIWDTVVDGTNTTPLGVYVQAALDDCKNTHSTLVFTPHTLLIGQGLTYDYGSHSIIGNGVRLDFSTMTVGASWDAADYDNGTYAQYNMAGVNPIAFAIVTPHNYYPLWDSAIHSISGVNFKGAPYGAARLAGITGVQFGVGLADTGAHASFYNNSVSGFDVGINFGHHSYVQKIDSCAIHNANIAVLYSGISLEDSGERIGFTNCVLFNSNTLVKAISGNISLSNCSFDYFTEEAIITEFGGSVYISDSHIESINNPNIKPWMVCRDSNSRICLSNTIIVVNESISVYIGVADDSTDGSDTGSADAGIFLSNTHISFTPSGEFTLPTIFKGAVYISNLTSFDGGRYSAANKRVHVHSDRNNLLADGSFEKNGTPVEWTISTGTAYTAPSIVSGTATTGTKSLSIVPEVGKSTKIYKSFQISPRGKPTLGFRLKGTAPTGSLTVTVGYASPTGIISDVSARTFLYAYTSADISTNWTTESIRPYSRAPLGATRFYVSFEATNGVDVNIDDIIVEILDNNVSSIDLSDTLIDSLSDVDTSVPPTDGQALVWNSSYTKWIPGSVASGGGGGGGLSSSVAENITGIWSFVNGAKLSALTFNGVDINDVSSYSDSGVTLNYTSPNSGSYFRDFTVFNGKGLAAMKIYGVSRAAKFYSKLQFGAITAGLNQIGYTGYNNEAGETAEIAVNYNSGFDPATDTYSFPYYRSFHIFDGKGGSLLNCIGFGRKVEINTDNFYVMNKVVYRNGVNQTELVNTATSSIILNLPTTSGTLALVQTPVAYKTASYTILDTDSVLLFDVPVGQTATLPAAGASTGKLYRISNVGANELTLTATSGVVQWGASQPIPSQVQRCVISDGNNWFWC